MSGVFKFVKSDGATIFETAPGAETEALKSRDPIVELRSWSPALLFAWLAVGDCSLPDEDHGKYSFLKDKSFRGLILTGAPMVERMAQEAEEFFCLFGSKRIGHSIVFLSGARIQISPADDVDQFKGWAFSRIGVYGDLLSQNSIFHLSQQLHGRPAQMALVREGD